MMLIKQESDYRLYLSITFEGRNMYMLRFLKSDKGRPEPEEFSRFFLYGNELENVMQYIQQSLNTKGNNSK